MSNPLPTDLYGAADWKDYDHNWREVDAEFLQSRSILRYQTNAQRDSVPSAGGLGANPTTGQFVYNATDDGLQFRSKDGTWKSYRPLPFNTKTVTDTDLLVKLAHTASGDKGITLSPTTVSTDLPINILNGVLTANATEISIKTGVTTVKLTTDATSLVVDKPVTATSIKLTGTTNPVIDATGKNAVLGVLDATTISATTITATGALTGGSGSINGVVFNTNYVNASGGFVSQGGYFFGDATSAVMRYRNPSTGTITGAYLQTYEGYINAVGGLFEIYSQLRVRNLQPIQYLNVAGTLLGYSGPVIYTATALTAANYPEGTIWVSP